MKSWLIGKDSDAGRDWWQEEQGTTEDEMAGWHHWLNGRESEWTPGVGDGQGGLVCCDSWGGKELDTTERLNWLTDWLTYLYSRKRKISPIQGNSLVDGLLLSNSEYIWKSVARQQPHLFTAEKCSEKWENSPTFISHKAFICAGKYTQSRILLSMKEILDIKNNIRDIKTY